MVQWRNDVQRDPIVQWKALNVSHPSWIASHSRFILLFTVSPAVIEYWVKLTILPLAWLIKSDPQLLPSVSLFSPNVPYLSLIRIIPSRRYDRLSVSLCADTCNKLEVVVNHILVRQSYTEGIFRCCEMHPTCHGLRVTWNHALASVPSWCRWSRGIDARTWLLSER